MKTLREGHMTESKPVQLDFTSMISLKTHTPISHSTRPRLCRKGTARWVKQLLVKTTYEGLQQPYYNHEA